MTFFKMIFLVIVLGLLHGMILLPVLLSLFGPGMCSGSKTSAGSSSKSTRSSSLSTPNIAIISAHRKEGKVRGGKGTAGLTLSAAAGHSAISADSGCCSYTVNLVRTSSYIFFIDLSYLEIGNYFLTNKFSLFFKCICINSFLKIAVKLF